MKIFILNPLIYSKKKSIMNTRPRQPLSLAYIASLLLEKNYKVKLLDANILKYKADRVIKEIKEYKPDVLILTSTPVDRWECPNSHIDSVFEVINKAKIEATILTGSHGSLAPDWIFKKCNVKYIVRNEPEMIVSNLVQAIEKKDVEKVNGVSYRINDKIVHNRDASRIDDLDDLPLPAYDLLPMDKYKYGFFDLAQPFSIMLTSRGCPFNCIFCLKTMSEGDQKIRSPENVVEEIEYLINNFKIKSIFFQDWEFTIDKKRVEEICDLILKKDLKFSWGCNARANDLDDKLVKKMRQAGCKRINIGFESGAQEILDKSGKNIKIEDIENAVKICRNNDINIGMYAILNLPGENFKTIRKTIKFLKKNNIFSMTPNLVIPYFSTPLFKKLKSKKNKDFNWDNIEKYAGRIEVKHNPKIARLYYKIMKRL